MPGRTGVAALDPPAVGTTAAAWAAAALVLHQGRRRRQALLTAALLAVAPLFLLGALYQLIAQVAGIAAGWWTLPR